MLCAGSDEEDDLLDLLGCQGGEDIIPSRRSKPKFTLTSKRTSHNDVAKCSRAEVLEQTIANQEMPKLSDAPIKDEIESLEFVLISGADNEGKPDEKQINKPNDIGPSGVAIPLEKSLLPMQTIIDNEPKRGSRFGELLGVNNALEFMTREKEKKVAQMDSTCEEGYQFGKYQPSVISKLDTKKLRPIISRKGDNLENEALILRPVTRAACTAELLDCDTLKPNKSLEDTATDPIISENNKHGIDTGEERPER